MSTGVNVGILPSASRTGPVAAIPTFTVNDEYTEAAYFIIDITAGAGFSLTVAISGVDPTSGKKFALLTSAALTATGTTVLRIGPAYTAAANTIAKDYMPPVFDVAVTLTGTATFSIGALFV